ncbi:mRNA-decapping enzyme subunit 1 [Nakaseomyces bracarensis]|uniref:mRNA-decapping enzyme subunit 1 n=1 Tax=Nakaseomyces bracarensis TaxID=273131 RepID=A0ABR4NWI5_9SACH
MASNNNDKDAEQALDFYRKALNFNVIGRYDPKIKQLLFHTPHASVYKWDFDRDEWAKLEYQGVLAIYLRDVTNTHEILSHQDSSMEASLLNGSMGQSNEGYGQGQVLSGRDIYNYGLIILNRINPDNFSMGIVPNSTVNKRKVFDSIEDSENPLECMGVEVKDELVIIKNLKHEVYGIWIHTVEDRMNVYELIKYLLENEPKTSFA